jgi:hypothetical protein
VTVLNAGLSEVAGCVVLSFFAESAHQFSINQYGDETGFEAFINHIHIEDEVPATMGPPELLRQAVMFAACVADRLQRAYPDDAFEIIIACADSYVVRFHKVRPDQSWLANDLESYDEPIMRVRIPGRRSPETSP